MPLHLNLALDPVVAVFALGWVIGRVVRARRQAKQGGQRLGLRHFRGGW